ncbi:WD repeat-containing protein 49, partial [Anarrhichthys ocellatus]|uniref:WD repeat-containing protein 49 n=1 Tax=Anarrhichthys ocellatus TaxID=433405 RepID=UPI0012EE9988
LKFTPWCLDYWVDPSNPDQAVLTIGDIGGWVSALYFTSAQISLFERDCLRTDSDSADVILWDELVKGKHRSCYTVTHRGHMPAWVRKVRYLDSLDAFVSCSTRAQSSMVIGWREKESRSLRVASFFTKRGVWDMDHHRGLNLIATAGVDHQVLLWNPYVTSKPVCRLIGHTGPVTAVCFMQTQQQLLSYSRDKVGVCVSVCSALLEEDNVVIKSPIIGVLIVIPCYNYCRRRRLWCRSSTTTAHLFVYSFQVLCLWDVSRQLCVHRLAGVFPETQEDTQTLLFVHEERQVLVLSFNSLLLLLETTEEEKRTSSHEQPVTCVLYNSLFRQVVSSDSASSVICWLAQTGQKVKQFHRCHGNKEISTMALDATQTRLFTAGLDGEVKVWDFSGRCLHRMNAGLGRAVEISQVLLLKRRILVMGWERMLTVFRLHSFSQSFVEPSEWKGGVQHRSDVLCAAFQPPQTLVTGSYDGEIIVWNNGTEKALRRLRPLAELGEGHVPDSHLGVNGKEDADNSIAITRLLFIPGRTSAAIATAGGADLVSCGGSGVVRLWNTVHSRLVGQFTAHNRDLGSIVMTVSLCGKYLVTADGEGTLKTWDIQQYCLEPDDRITKEPPELLRSFRPHLDRVTHLEMCPHGDRLLVLSASSDRSVVLSYLPGEIVGLFGQEEQWCLERPGHLHPQWEPERNQRDQGGQGGKRSPPAPSETLPDPGPDTSAEGGEVGIKDQGEDFGSDAGVERNKHLSRSRVESV